MSRRHKRFDFTMAEVLLGAVLVIMIVWIGVYVHHVKQASDSNYAAGMTNTVSVTAASHTSSKAIAPVAYLDIPEWGVRLPLTDNLKDAYYVIRAEGPDTVFLGLRSLTDLAPRCAPDEMALGIIYRLSDEKQAAAIAYAEAEDAESNNSLRHNIHISGYYYGFDSVTANCVVATNGPATRLFHQLRPNVGFAVAQKTLSAIPGS